MADTRNFQGELLLELERLLDPLLEAAQGLTPSRTVIGVLGWSLEGLPSFPVSTFDLALSNLATSVTALRASIASPPQSLSDWSTAGAAGLTAIRAVAQLSQILAGASLPSELQTIGEDLLNLLAGQYLRDWHPAIYALFGILGIVEQQTVDAIADDGTGTYQRFPITIATLDLSKVSGLLKNPSGALNTEYGTSGGLIDPNGTADKLFPRIVAFLQELNVDATYSVDSDLTAVLGPDGFPIAAHTMTVFKAINTPTSTSGGFGAALTLDSILGLLVKPFGTVKITEALSEWILDIDGTATVGGFALSRAGVTFPTGGEAPGAMMTVTAVKLPPPDRVDDGDGPAVLIGSATGTRLELGGLLFQGQATLSATSPKYGFSFLADQGAIVISPGTGDGFLSTVLPSETRIAFDLAGGWMNDRGFFLGGGANLTVDLPVHLSIGPVDVDHVHLTITAAASIAVLAQADVSVELGPVTATIAGLGLSETLTFPSGGGNLGPLDLQLGFQFPTGVGIAVDAGPVSGGGFLSFDPANHRYGGALELSVYSIAVKAFGLVETQLPTGPGYSFVIIISAEFTPIQLGLGFTLTGVGGLIGINRTVDADQLTAAVLKGNLDSILFPQNVVQNAPTLIHDLQAFFPAAAGRYVFGPLAKIGWGTPTLVEGKLGLLLELPGPILTLLGNIQAHLPKSAPGGNALVSLNIDIAGRLDFPKKHFELDGALHDSKVGDYPVSGSMAMRLDWGDSPNFAISLGGFNPTFNPPSGFPHLQRIAVDLGLAKNPRVTLAGYMALTSNTAQIGASLDAWASKYGGTLSGTLGFDALFVFSPFSFNVDLHGSVRADWEGWGGTLKFHGTISGPSPWRIYGQVCVSVWFLSACVGLNETLGNASQPVLPSLDPWTGNPATAALSDQTTPGLQAAIQDVRNWSGTLPPNAATGVTYAPVATGDSIPIDPVGIATFRQKAVPLDFPITLFAGTAPKTSGAISVTAVKIGGTPIPSPGTTPVSDYFAPAQFRAMSTAEKLSSPSFESLHAGFAIQSAAVTAGGARAQTPQYDTTVLDVNGNIQPPPPQYSPSQLHLLGMATGTGAGRLGIRFAGTTRFTDPSLPRKVTDSLETYLVINKVALTAIATPAGGTRAQAADAVDRLSTSAFARRQYQVVPSFLVPAA